MHFILCENYYICFMKYMELQENSPENCQTDFLTIKALEEIENVFCDSLENGICLE